MLLAAPAVVMPYRWMNAIHQGLGLGTLPDVPIVNYLTRSESALYVIAGVFTLAIARRPRQYAALITLWGCCVLAFGALFLPIDLSSRMPLVWTSFEGPYLVILGSTVLILSRWGASASAQVNETETPGQAD